jgi:hypothetical protein
MKKAGGDFMWNSGKLDKYRANQGSDGSQDLVIS